MKVQTQDSPEDKKAYTLSKCKGFLMWINHAFLSKLSEDINGS
jgi:hypothetical protein